MGIRIAIVNPVGSGIYDDQMERTLQPFAQDDATLDVMHFEGVPEDIAFYVPKHIIELALMELTPELERAEYDAVIVGCCFDPGVRVLREAVDIPVIGPLEASINYASFFGHDYSIITDSHPKSVPWIADLTRLYGGVNCRGIHAIDLPAPEMVARPMEVASTAVDLFGRMLDADGSDMILVGCTTIAACLEEAIAVDPAFAAFPFLNPMTLALLSADGLARLHRKGRYRLSRRGFYRRHDAVNATEADEIKQRFRLNDRSGQRLGLVGRNGTIVSREDVAVSMSVASREVV